jgi:hypothetical protein
VARFCYWCLKSIEDGHWIKCNCHRQAREKMGSEFRGAAEEAREMIRRMDKSIDAVVEAATKNRREPK